MWSSAQESRAKNGVRLAGLKRLQKHWIIVGAVFEICVLHQNDVAGGGRETTAQGRALASVYRMINDLIDYS